MAIDDEDCEAGVRIQLKQVKQVNVAATVDQHDRSQLARQQRTTRT
jgi:hypothetical protein